MNTPYRMGETGGSGIRIREARESDAAAVAGLWTEAYVTLGVGGRSEPYTSADFLESSRRGAVLVAEGAGGLEGVVVLQRPTGSGGVAAATGEAELARLAVRAAARRTGIGRVLTELCERRARAAGWTAIALWSRPLQVEAHRLYESLGYVRVPERDSVDATGQGRLVFRLALSTAGRPSAAR